MHYGHPPHIFSTEDLTLLKCLVCGWNSPEITLAGLRERGLPWYCDRCHKQNLTFVHFHPSERAEAYKAIGVAP